MPASELPRTTARWALDNRKSRGYESTLDFLPVQTTRSYKVPQPTEIVIHIDGKQYKSPNPTTGHALYVLASVKPGYALFRETKGPGDDELIKDDQASVTLNHGDHFYTAQRDLNPG
jgi:hypothetical protein